MTDEEARQRVWRMLGQKVTLVFEASVGGGVVEIKGTIEGPPELRGWITASGAWALHGGPTERPAYRFRFRERWKRNVRSMLIHDLTEIREGWK